jgi:hypothetical protein
MSQWTVVAVLVVCALILGSYAMLPERGVDLSAFPRLTDATLADRTIVDFGTSDDGTVAYSYLAEPVPAQLAENEVPELRNENSYTILLEVPKDGEDLKLQTIFYAQPAYAQDIDGSWKYLEYATTSEQVFRNRDTTLWKSLVELVVRTAYADSTSPFSGAGDGYVESVFVDGGLGLISCRLTGTSFDYTSTGSYVNVFNDLTIPRDCTNDRTFLPFDTSAIPSNSSVSAATLYIYVLSKQNGDDDGSDYITVSTSTQTSSSALEVADFNTVGRTEGIDSGARLDITSITTGAYNSFALNSTGIGWITFNGQTSTCGTNSGVTCLALLEGHDISGGGGLADDQANSITIYMSEQTGTSQDPYLSVTYTAPAASVVARGSGKVAPGGSVRVVNGKLLIR